MYFFISNVARLSVAASRAEVLTMLLWITSALAAARLPERAVRKEEDEELFANCSLIGAWFYAGLEFSISHRNIALLSSTTATQQSSDTFCG